MISCSTNPVTRPRIPPCRAIALVLTVLLTVAATPASTQTLDYDVLHPWLGKIGNYENTILRQGTTVIVKSKLRVAAKILGIVVHREDADRIEIWRDGRLVGFSGVTTINGHSVAIRGKASGSVFVVTSPAGTVTAPGNVTPNNPWSCNFIHGTTVFAVNTGTVEPAQVTGGQTVALDIAGHKILTRYYRVESARTHAQVWLNDDCVPVRMDVINNGTNISLVLRRETEAP
jgi:Family of unknown function (DUF6134)